MTNNAEYQPTFDALPDGYGYIGPNTSAQELVDMGLAQPTEESISIVQGLARGIRIRPSRTERQVKESQEE